MTPRVPRSIQIAVAAGLGAALACPGTAGFLGAVGAAGVIAGWRSDGGTVDRLGWQVATALLILVGMFAAQGLGAGWDEVGLGLLVWLTAQRAWVARSAQDHRIALLLSMLMLLICATLTRSMWLAAAVIAWALAAPVGLARAQLMASADRDPRAATVPLGGLVAVGPVGLAVGGVVFLFLPRLSAGLLAAEGEIQDLSGFSDEVTLGDLGAIKDNTRLVLRAEVREVTADGDRPLTAPFYFRGMALEIFDGQRWSNAFRAGRRELVAVNTPQLAPGTIEARIMLEPLGDPVVFAPPQLYKLRMDDVSSVINDGLGTWRFSQEPRRVEYTAWSTPATSDPAVLNRDLPLPEGFQEHFTRLPEDLDPRVVELARAVTAGETTSWGRAKALERHLRQNYEYTLLPDEDSAGAPLERFLFTTRRGHCEYYATALAVMLRSLDIPAVLVTGFYGGEWNPMGGYWSVRQSDAHSWVEVFIGEARWVPLDATPADAAGGGRSGWWTQMADVAVGWWHSQVLDYDIQSQLELAGTAARLVGGPSQPASSAPGALGAARTLALPLVVLVVLGFMGLRTLPGVSAKKAARPSPVARVHGRAWRLATKRGWRPPPGLPPVAAAEWLVAEAGQAAAPLEALAWLHYRVRYRGEADSAHLKDARALLAQLKGLPRRGSDLAGPPTLK